MADTSLEEVARKGVNNSKKGIVVFSLAIVFFVIMGSSWLVLCSSSGASQRMTMRDVASEWLTGTDASKTYSGALIKTIDCFERALLNFGLAILSSFALLIVIGSKQYHERVLRYIREKGCGAKQPVAGDRYAQGEPRFQGALSLGSPPQKRSGP